MTALHDLIARICAIAWPALDQTVPMDAHFDEAY
jgi:hypothetical protein